MNAVEHTSAPRPPVSVPLGDELLSMNVRGFYEDIEKLRAETYASIGSADFEHLKRVERRGRLFSFIGYATAWIFPNPVSAFCISFGHFTRWLFAHHILHRGYDKVPGIPARYTSKQFARGWRRYIDWFDWLPPDAWDYEHNVLHHYRTGEESDPDPIERHLEFLRAARVPVFLKHIFIFLAAISWKYTHYAPNTLSVLDPESKKRLKTDHIAYITIKNIFEFRNKHVRKLWTEGYLPYGIAHFVLIPALFLPLGTTAATFVLINKILAECITNLHSFFVISPNHVADDLYRYNFHYEDREQFYVIQVIGSANYRVGTELLDHLSIWLNYQIEHHLFPDLPMLKYREVQPRVKALCEKHSIPYRQEGIFRRFKRMIDVCVGKTDLREIQEFPVPAARAPEAA